MWTELQISKKCPPGTGAKSNMSEQPATSPGSPLPKPGSVTVSGEIFGKLLPKRPSFFLLRYGEIGLKSRPVRQHFLTVLEQNLLKRFAQEGLSPVVTREQGRIYLFCGDLDTSARLLRTTPGIVSFSLCLQGSSNFDEIMDSFAAIAALHLKEGDSFAIRARRVGDHSFTSQELGMKAGERVLNDNSEKKLTVNLSKPQKPLFVEVRGLRSFFYLGSEPGVGGFPVGVAGNAISFPGPKLLAGPSLLMMKRGCRVLPVIPEDKLHSDRDLEKLVENLDSYHVKAQTYIFPNGGGDSLHSFMRKRKVKGLIFHHTAKELDALMEENPAGGDVRSLLLEQTGLVGELLKEHCLSLPFFFPLLGGLFQEHPL